MASKKAAQQSGLFDGPAGDKAVDDKKNGLATPEHWRFDTFAEYMEFRKSKVVMEIYFELKYKKS